MNNAHTTVLIAVDGGNVQGCRSNNANVTIVMFDQDNLRAEGKSKKEIDELWKKAEKKYAYPVY